MVRPTYELRESEYKSIQLRVTGNWVTQDECAYHSNDDTSSEWTEDGKGMSIKQKSRGALLMLSMFLSELKGVLKSSRQQMTDCGQAP